MQLCMGGGRHVATKEPSVPKGQAPRSIHLNPILIMAKCLHHVPDLSHLLGLGPCWFCRNTLAPGSNGRSGLEWVPRDSAVRDILVRSASSFAAHA